MTSIQVAALFLLAAVWGASFLFMRVAGPEFGPIALIAIRVTLASLVLLPIWYWRQAKSERDKVSRHWKQILFLGLTNSAIPFVLFAYATLFITGGLASILNSTASIWTALVAWVWLAQKPSLRTSIGLIVGLLGVVVLVYEQVGGAVTGSLSGVIAAAGAGVMYGIAANYTTQKLAGLSSLTLATFSLVAASLALIPLAIIFAPDDLPSAEAWAAVLAMGILSTALANIIYFNLLSKVGATKVVSVAFLIPMFGILWGVMFIDEQITAGMVTGGLIIFAGIAMVLQLPMRFKNKQAS